MKTINKIIAAGIVCAAFLGSCKIDSLELQKNFEYKPGSTVDPKINKTALQYLRDRGKNPVVLNDTVFKYMQLGLEYAGLDLAEYEKLARTFIFLSNNSIRVLPTTTTAGVVRTTSNIPISGFWFTFPIMEKNPDGSQKYNADGTPVSHPATSWNEYSPATVRNYFLSFIGQGDLGFNNLTSVNQSLTSILPVGTVATRESALGYLVVNSEPALSTNGLRGIRFDYSPNSIGRGFDLESKFNLKQTNTDFSPMVLNDATSVATGGLVATNGQIHVISSVTFPSRY